MEHKHGSSQPQSNDSSSVMLGYQSLFLSRRFCLMRSPASSNMLSDRNPTLFCTDFYWSLSTKTFWTPEELLKLLPCKTEQMVLSDHSPLPFQPGTESSAHRSPEKPRSSHDSFPRGDIWRYSCIPTERNSLSCFSTCQLSDGLRLVVPWHCG